MARPRKRTQELEPIAPRGAQRAPARDGTRRSQPQPALAKPSATLDSVRLVNVTSSARASTRASNLRRRTWTGPAASTARWAAGRLHLCHVSNLCETNKVMASGAALVAQQACHEADVDPS